MQIFIIGGPLETALVLDKRRFNSQIREAKIILNWCNLINNGEGKRWVNQPLAKMYINNINWLSLYIELFESVKNNDLEKANEIDRLMLQITPNWHCEEYYIQMKRRLYTKNPKFYNKWHYLGESYDNWYWVGGRWKKFPQNK